MSGKGAVTLRHRICNACRMVLYSDEVYSVEAVS